MVASVQSAPGESQDPAISDPRTSQVPCDFVNLPVWVSSFASPSKSIVTPAPSNCIALGSGHISLMLFSVVWTIRQISGYSNEIGNRASVNRIHLPLPLQSIAGILCSRTVPGCIRELLRVPSKRPFLSVPSQNTTGRDLSDVVPAFSAIRKLQFAPRAPSSKTGDQFFKS